MWRQGRRLCIYTLSARCTDSELALNKGVLIRTILFYYNSVDAAVSFDFKDEIVERIGTYL